MEGSESEAVFDSLNLNPQLFINEALNSVDDLVEDAFTFFNQRASEVLKTDGSNRSEELTKGVEFIQNMVKSNLDKRLNVWEKYCLHRCFVVPQGFSLPKSDETSGGSTLDIDALGDSDLDLQLDSLREKLSLAGQECAELNSEIQRLENESASTNHSAASIEEALQPYEKHSMHEMFQELIELESEFRTKVEKLKPSKKDKTESGTAGRANMQNGESVEHNNGLGIFNAKFEELQEMLDIIKA